MSDFAPMPDTVPPNACETVSGHYVDIVNPQAQDIKITDIAWSLARQVRFAGHTLGDPYHIAQHAVFVADLLDMVLDHDFEGGALRSSFDKWLSDRHWPSLIRKPVLLINALGHDNSEAYLVDLPSPVKRHPELRASYKPLEENLMKVINEALDIPEMNECEARAVQWADLIALQIEAASQMASRGRGWNGDLPQFNLEFINYMPKIKSWRAANDEYLERFYELKRCVV